MNINENEKKVLTYISIGDFEEGSAFHFSGIMSHTGLDRKQVRRACRSLAKKGLTECIHGLWTEDGEPAGSGYAATEEGVKFIKNEVANEEEPIQEPNRNFKP